MNGSGSQSTCAWSSFFLDVAPQPLPIENSFCPYIDPNSVENINGKGNNYFRSSNPYKLNSLAGFGEAYYNINQDLKITAGLRYTRVTKTFTLVPTQLLRSAERRAGKECVSTCRFVL